MTAYFPLAEDLATMTPAPAGLVLWVLEPDDEDAPTLTPYPVVGYARTGRDVWPVVSYGVTLMLIDDGRDERSPLNAAVAVDVTLDGRSPRAADVIAAMETLGEARAPHLPSTFTPAPEFTAVTP